MKHIIIIVTLLVLNSCFLSPVENNKIKVINEDQKIFISNENIKYISIHNDYAVLGAPTYADGSVHIFKKISNIWEIEKTFNSYVNNFGNNVDIFNDNLIVGSSGYYFIYNKIDTSWLLQNQVQIGTTPSVSISQESAVVAAPERVTILHKTNNVWSSETTLSFNNNGGTPIAKLYQNILIVGLQRSEPNQRGYVNIYKRDETWNSVDTLNAWDARDYDNFGYDVDKSNKYIIVGAPGDNSGDSVNTGAAYIYKLENEEWIFDAKLTIENSHENLKFGSSVAISDNFAVVGTQYDDEGGDNAGAAFLYKKTLIGWSLKSKLMASDAEQFDQFGNVVVISDNNDILISSVNIGSVYYFKP